MHFSQGVPSKDIPTSESERHRLPSLSGYAVSFMPAITLLWLHGGATPRFWEPVSVRSISNVHRHFNGSKGGGARFAVAWGRVTATKARMSKISPRIAIAVPKAFATAADGWRDLTRTIELTSNLD